MNKDCSELKTIVEELIAGIDQLKKIHASIRSWNPGFEEVSEENCEDREALIWMHGSTDVWERNELERWLFHITPRSGTAESEAMDNYLAWIDHVDNGGGDYAEVETGMLPNPDAGESLENYIIRLSEMVEDEVFEERIPKRTLNSFLHFLRDDFRQEDVAFIEHILPLKRGLRGGKIIRLIKPQVYPIPQQLASAIIKALAHQCAFGRSNARRHAGEVLAFLWLCLASSRVRWPRTLESVYEIEKDALVFDNGFPELMVPSFFGPQRVRIGDRVAKFLLAVGRMSPGATILQTPLADLRKTFRTAIKKMDVDPNMGEITFLTFLTYPHHFGKHIRPMASQTKKELAETSS